MLSGGTTGHLVSRLGPMGASQALHGLGLRILIGAPPCGRSFRPPRSLTELSKPYVTCWGGGAGDMKTLKPALHIKEFEISDEDVQWAREMASAEARRDEA